MILKQKEKTFHFFFSTFLLEIHLSLTSGRLHDAPGHHYDAPGHHKVGIDISKVVRSQKLILKDVFNYHQGFVGHRFRDILNSIYYVFELGFHKRNTEKKMFNFYKGFSEEKNYEKNEFFMFSGSNFFVFHFFYMKPPQISFF